MGGEEEGGGVGTRRRGDYTGGGSRRVDLRAARRGWSDGGGINGGGVGLRELGEEGLVRGEEGGLHGMGLVQGRGCEGGEEGLVRVGPREGRRVDPREGRRVDPREGRTVDPREGRRGWSEGGEDG